MTKADGIFRWFFAGILRVKHKNYVTKVTKCFFEVAASCLLNIYKRQPVTDFDRKVLADVSW